MVGVSGVDDVAGEILHGHLNGEKVDGRDTHAIIPGVCVGFH